ncbi:right-handed parallel beta-helix repeat-containing protein [Pseudalkalibacillus berkeleyi]|uniref:Right-handed parallel beta-helix repeat-containing protein n=1 Tax=Pseudalkalibacillus berkeleyi TaxID=1069813 RepID=A0ABS9H2K1_9BACL|nr:right-handed parallel beta-helix repeat-containing protein [Pseudalkalibacillus berkeleyi]MCF6139182.1 right-handed parallel beta-helix repeat-containing protein [Pseudalkalibacillus berkeleyi]
MTTENKYRTLSQLFEQWNHVIKEYHDDISNIVQSARDTERSDRSVIHVPKDFSSILQAVNAAASGDTILVADGVYQECITVPSSKASLRIIANGSKVILNGKGELDTAFTLEANNIEVSDFSITNYVKAGIEVTGVYGVKLIGNTIEKVTEGHGIQLDQKTFSNLIWKNKISHARLDGINLQSKNVWVVDNEFSYNRQSGVRIQKVGNHIVGNRVTNNEHGIVEDQGFNLIYDNDVSMNRQEGIHLPSGIGSSITLGNQVNRNKQNGMSVKTVGNSILDNLVNNNEKTGIKIESALNVLELNKIDDHMDNGVVLSAKALKNLVYQNLLKGNKPENLVVKNQKNTILQNRIITSPFLRPEEVDTVKQGVLHVPKEFPTISEAVNAASIGDTILVSNGVYKEEVSVPISKSGLNLIANGNRVILDGEGKLNIGFALASNLVQVKGFKIQNYAQAGITVKGTGISLIANTINNITDGSGIELSLAFSTLMWKNKITKAKVHGITIKAMNTWIVNNDISSNGENGINYEGSTTVGSTITKNRIKDNGQNGISDTAGFNFIYNNEMMGNKQNGVYEVSGLGSGAIIKNKLYLNQNGVRLDNEGAQVAGNTIRSNSKSGVMINSDFNNLTENTIARNHHNGVELTPEANNNLIYKNQIVENRPVDIKSTNPNNTFIDNKCMNSEPPEICKRK